jgi:hypothetical protein
VKAPIDILGLSNGARSGLTGFVAGVARTPKLAAPTSPSTTCCRACSTPTASRHDGRRGQEDRQDADK